jgi:hypothetical protein
VKAMNRILLIKKQIDSFLLALLKVISINLKIKIKIKFLMI